MHMRLTWMKLALAAWILTVGSSHAAPSIDYGRVEVLRDQWGVPHVFSPTDEGALYGLGYIAARERGFQMTYNLRIIQGRLAELVGHRTRPGGRETALDHDRKMRTFGWSQAAERTARHLDAESLRLLTAYCEGINDSFAAQKRTGQLHPLFERFGCEPEPWTPPHCLLSWWHLAQFFATDGTRDLMVWRNRAHPQPGRPEPPQSRSDWIDDSVAVVQRGDVSDAWIRRVEDFANARGLGPNAGGGEGPKFSHAWVVGGQRSTTGAATLVSDPQTPVRNPSLWMEFHLSGKTMDVRGIGVPGSPALLIGFNRHVAWGLTALGADQADLFRLETSPEHPDAYRWNGSWRPMEIRTERIPVRDAAPVELRVRETHLGPVASEFCFRQPGDPEVALKRVPLCQSDRETIQGAFAMMRARDAREFALATGRWSFPSANCVFGDSAGRIGYTLLAAIPVRSSNAGDTPGNTAMEGLNDRDDWLGFVPPDLLPNSLQPSAAVVFSGNHRPIGRFYPLPLGLSTGSLGDTIRSWRLRELLTGGDPISPEAVLNVHYDCVNPARRDMVRLGLQLRKTDRERLSEDGVKALALLEKWLAAGASSDLHAAGAELATRLSTFFRFVVTPLALQYGGGESGLARFLKATVARLEADPDLNLNAEEANFIDKTLREAWRAEPSRGSATSGGRVAPLAWFDSLDGFGSLDRNHDIQPQGLSCLDGQTLRSQRSQSYTQWVPLHDVDSAQTICPIGHSDRLDSRYRTSTLTLWQQGKLHPAPLSRPAIEAVTVEHLRLSE